MWHTVCAYHMQHLQYTFSWYFCLIKIQRRGQFYVQHSAGGMMMNFEVLQGDESLTCLTPSRFWNQSDKQSLLRCRKVKNHFFQKNSFWKLLLKWLRGVWPKSNVEPLYYWDFDFKGTISLIFALCGRHRRCQSQKECWLEPMPRANFTQWCSKFWLQWEYMCCTMWSWKNSTWCYENKM